jgi:uncharacterized LabA/DUF88 family protein
MNTERQGFVTLAKGCGRSHVTERSKTVVMLIDWDNLQICHSRDAPGTDLDLHALIALAQSYGTLVSARAYAEWNLLSERLAVYKAGIEPVFAPVMRPENSPREGKSLADTVMVADGVDLLWTVTPDVFVLVTSDKDMIPLARIAKQRGAAVVVLGSDLTAIPLVEMSNVFITYRQLLRELDRVTELEAPSGRAPARERRLRETRRPSSEPYGGPAPLGSGVRGVGRPAGPAVALRTPQTALEAAPPRRLAEPAPSPEAERPSLAVTAPVRTVTPAAPLPSSDRTELGALSSSDATPRRRRRRGGRGRRPDVAIGSDDDVSIGDDTFDAESEERTGADARLSPVSDVPDVRTDLAPDDLDTAVLELLASRDRRPEEQAAESTPAVASVESPPERTTTRVSTSRTASGRTGVRRRATTTTFSDFGPSPSRRREREAELEQASATTVEPVIDAAPLSSDVDIPSASAESSETVSPDVTDAQSIVTDDRAPVAEDSHRGDDEAPLDFALEVSATEPASGTTESEAAAPADAASDDTATAVAEPPTADAPISTEASTAIEPAVEGEQAVEPEAARPVRRRRTRRTTPKATTEAAAEPAAAES